MTAEELGEDDKAQCWTDSSNLCSAASSSPSDDADGLLPTTRRAKGGDGPARGISLGSMQMKHLKHSETLGKITARIGLTSAYQTERLESVNE